MVGLCVGIIWGHGWVHQSSGTSQTCVDITHGTIASQHKSPRTSSSQWPNIKETYQGCTLTSNKNIFIPFLTEKKIIKPCYFHENVYTNIFQNDKLSVIQCLTRKVDCNRFNIYLCVLLQNGIVHRDLKLENILLDDKGNVKVSINTKFNIYFLI